MNDPGSSLQTENANGIITGNLNNWVFPEMIPDGFKYSTYLQFFEAIDKIQKYTYGPMYRENLSSFNITMKSIA